MSENPREEKVLERRETLTMSKFSEFKQNKNGDYSQHLVTGNNQGAGLVESRVHTRVRNEGEEEAEMANWTSFQHTLTVMD